MDIALVLSWLLGVAVLVPLGSFLLILVFGPLMGRHGRQAGYCATAAILTSCVLAFIALGVWLSVHPPQLVHHGEHAGAHHAAATGQTGQEPHLAHGSVGEHPSDRLTATEHRHDRTEDTHGAAADLAERIDLEHAIEEPPAYSKEIYSLALIYDRQVSISVYIDALTICMFVMVTLIATCIHVYAMGYMHDELTDDHVDSEVIVSSGQPLHRRGRFHRFFQYLSLFSFSMLGLVLSGNIAMTFVFWELVGICSYFLIGFYIERKTASDAANKAFIVNRIGDFGMIIGLMAIWGSLGTFTYGGADGIFAQVRPARAGFQLTVPDAMVRAEATGEIEKIVMDLGATASAEEIDAAVIAQLPRLRGDAASGIHGGYGRWLLVIAGLGIFCGCVGKSAQFPLHVWLPDAMEGPTPVSALVHSATMVAAGVFLVGRFYPVFAAEVLLVIAIVGTITLFLAATIAIVATDIKRVLAYSTISQLGYMMLALGVGGWLAGLMHLFTHAFFKSLLFMCSGSVIHAVHTNDMSQMGGLRKKMPWTAYTMLVGCLAIAGAGIPFAIPLFGHDVHLGLSGFYSKDAILEQALLFRNTNPAWGTLFFLFAAGGAAITAFYMFRLWFMTFAGEPRDPQRYEHAHESPPVMYRPLIVLATMAVAVAWGPVEGIVGSMLALALFLYLRFRPSGSARSADHGHGDHGPARNPLEVAIGISGLALLACLLWLPLDNVRLSTLLEQARPAGILLPQSTMLFAEGLTWPNEHLSHEASIRVPATWIAFSTALGGFLLATMFYGLRKLDPSEAQRAFAPIYRLLWNKWYFDEWYGFLFVRPAHVIAQWIARFDRLVIDGFIDSLARITRVGAAYWEWFSDRKIVDGLANGIGSVTYRTGLSLRRVQTGSLRQYVMFIVVGTVVVFAIASFWRLAIAG